MAGGSGCTPCPTPPARGSPQPTCCNSSAIAGMIRSCSTWTRPPTEPPRPARLAQTPGWRIYGGKSSGNRLVMQVIMDPIRKEPTGANGAAAGPDPVMDGDQKTFMQDVIQASKEVPVLV